MPSGPLSDPDDDLYVDPDDYDDEWPRCGCRYCHCVLTTEHGEPCVDCENGAHQG